MGQPTLTVQGSPRLSWRQRLAMKVAGHAYLGHRTRPGWRGELPFYAFECPEHGVVADYPQGFEGRLTCPRCSGVEWTQGMAPQSEAVGVEAEASHP